MTWYALLITGLLLLSQTPMQGASKASASATHHESALKIAKRQLFQELNFKIPTQSDGTAFVYDTELQDMTTCLQSFETLIKKAKTTDECSAISQKLNFVKMLVYNRTIMVSEDAPVQSLYTVLIPRILARTQVRSRNNITIFPK